MPDGPELLPFTILVSACVGLLFLMLFVLFRMNARLGKLELLLSVKKDAESVESPEVYSETVRGGPFEAFLEEDPSRRLLTKKEQSAAYRKWRQDMGMNWSNS
jgi:hypothetical protein